MQQTQHAGMKLHTNFLILSYSTQLYIFSIKKKTTKYFRFKYILFQVEKPLGHTGKQNDDTGRFTLDCQPIWSPAIQVNKLGIEIVCKCITNCFLSGSTSALGRHSHSVFLRFKLNISDIIDF